MKRIGLLPWLGSLFMIVWMLGSLWLGAGVKPQLKPSPVFVYCWDSTAVQPLTEQLKQLGQSGEMEIIPGRVAAESLFTRAGVQNWQNAISQEDLPSVLVLEGPLNHKVDSLLTKYQKENPARWDVDRPPKPVVRDRWHGYYPLWHIIMLPVSLLLLGLLLSRRRYRLIPFRRVYLAGGGDSRYWRQCQRVYSLRLLVVLWLPALSIQAGLTLWQHLPPDFVTAGVQLVAVLIVIIREFYKNHEKSA